MAEDMAGRIAALEQELQALKARTKSTTEETSTSRRTMLRTLAIGAAGAATAGVAGVVAARPAAAADTDPLKLGLDNQYTTLTNTTYDGAVQATSFTIQSGAAPTTAPTNATILDGAFEAKGTAFLGVANGAGKQNIGVIGWSKTPDGTGVIGFTGGAGRYGGEFFGGRAEVRLRPGSKAPIDPTAPPAAHLAGELFEDQDNNLWLCVKDGTPGDWRQLGGPKTAGQLNLLPSPVRVYDSRAGQGPASTGDGRLAGLAERVINLTTGFVGTTATPAVPAGATGAQFTLTVADTVDAGFLSAFSAAVPFPGTSTINWSATGQLVATTTVSAVDLTGKITIHCGGSTVGTNFLIDVVGYYL